MIELVQLERRHEDFANRNTRVIVASMDGSADSQKTQTENPHLFVLSDANRRLTEAVQILHPQMANDGGDTDMPTSMIIDGNGIVRWIFRPDSIVARLSPDELLMAVDRVRVVK